MFRRGRASTHLVISCTVLSLAGVVQAQTTWHVDVEHCPGPGSGTAMDPFCTIQSGIAAAVDGDTISVADGVYTGDGNRDIDFAGKLITVQSQNGSASTIIDCAADELNPHRAFVFQSGETDATALEGFTIRNGYAPDHIGGAIHISNSSPTISGCIFENNQAVAQSGVENTGKGGAIHVTDISEGTGPTITECVFIDNVVVSGGASRTGNGGGIAVLDGAAVITGCSFHRNIAIQVAPLGGSGAALSVRTSEVVVQDCEFIDNVADWVAGAIAVSSDPGLELWSRLDMSGCTFIGNSSFYEGGAIWNGKSDLFATNCTFAGNTSSRGAAIFGWFPGPNDPTVYMNCLVVGNQAGVGATIGHVSGPTRHLYLRHCTVIANAGDRGGISNSAIAGAAYMEVTNTVAWGNQPTQILMDDGTTIEVTYTCVQEGASEPWFGVGCLEEPPAMRSMPDGAWTAAASYDPDTFQTTFVNDSASWQPAEYEGLFLNPNTTQVHQSLIVANTATTITVWGDCADLGTSGAGYELFDYRVQPGSPLIDSGNNAMVPADVHDLDDDEDVGEPTPVDLLENSRFENDRGMQDCHQEPGTCGVPPIVDIGAYEFQGTTPCMDIEDIAACGDEDADGVRDDNCMWWGCVDGVCQGTEIVFADMGGQFGDCQPDGTADGNDRFLALNCFSNVAPGNGGPFPCEDQAPAAVNVDAGGQFGSCAPDGVCDGNDAFAALNAFDGSTPCTCPLDGGPAPDVVDGPIVVDAVVIEMVPVRERVRARDLVEVDVYITGGVADLRGYQLHPIASPGVELVDMYVDPRADHVFAGRDYWAAYNLETGQMVVGIDTHGVASKSPRLYLATLAYVIPASARGVMIDLLHDRYDPVHRTFLFATPSNGQIDIIETVPAIIDVEPLKHKVSRR